MLTSPAPPTRGLTSTASTDPGTSQHVAAGGQYEPSVPPVRDRIVQAAVKIVLEPVFEADFLPCSFGFRPKRSAQDALQVLIEECWRGRRWVVETDIASCFDPWSYCSFADCAV